MAISSAVEKEVVPVVEKTAPSYTDDAMPTFDGWADKILAALRKISDKWLSGAMRKQYRRMSASIVSDVTTEATDNFYKSINAAIGVNMRQVAAQGDLSDFMEAMAAQNASLITSIPQEYLLRVENAVVQGTLNGEAPSVITRNIQAAAGVSYRRAKNISRDQVSKMTGQVVEKRQQDAGVVAWRWVTSKDERVGSDHRAAANRDIGLGKGIYPTGYSPKEGSPGNANRPNCRCSRTPIFEFELPEGWEKVRNRYVR